ncbi:MAG: hypothetical protein KC422_07475 [Trueperaceae bacterium]|nr:hypothetical protein [Trueperaceae bacterium]
MVQEEKLSQLLETHCKEHESILLAFIGHSANGSVVARYKSIDASSSRMGMHAAEVWRACRRLHGVLPDMTESIQFTSTSKTERIVAQKLTDTPYYLAFVMQASVSFQETARTFKVLMKQTKEFLLSL